MVNPQALPVHFVIRLDLERNGIDPREQVRRPTCDLAPNYIAEVHTHGITPPPVGVPFVNAYDFAWYRKDIAWKFIDKDSRVVKRWHDNIAELRTWI
jgi:hypothetical protein